MPLQQLTAHQGIMKTSRGNGIIAADKGNEHLNSAMKKMISAYEKNNDDMWKNKRTYISPMDRGLGDSAPKTSPRLRSTMQATGPDMWAEVLRNVIGHELPPVYFEPINASAVSYTKKPSDLRRDSI
jgi:hypothetical protein